MTSNSGVAGRIDYGQWDRVASDLINETEEQEKKEEDENAKALGLDGKYAVSKADAEERQKRKDVEKAKEALDKYKKRETAVIKQMTNIFSNDTDGDEVVRVTRASMEAGKRVLTLSDTKGKSPKDSKIVLTQDLSHLESTMPTNSSQVVKKFAEDVENDVPVAAQQMRSVFGLIKLFVTDVHNCTIVVQNKIITGTIEVSHCSNVVLKIEKEATVATLQVDLCHDVSVEFRDAPSGKNGTAAVTTMYWGDDKEDRIYHAGVKNMKIALIRDGFCETETMVDYETDGAVSVGNATLEEYQFVTSVVNQEFMTERVVRSGATTGKNARAMTDRELEEERVIRESAVDMLMEKAIRFVEKGEGKMDDTKVVPAAEKAAQKQDEKEEDVEEVYTNPSEIKGMVQECEDNKARGNEAFGSGEYAQAVLLYSLALDTADGLPDKESGGSKQLFPRHIVLSNRSACFLKLGEHEKALADSTRAQEIDPTYVKGVFRKGLALHAMSKYSEAMPILAKAHKLEPKNKQIKQALQFCEVRLNQEMRKRMQGSSR